MRTGVLRPMADGSVHGGSTTDKFEVTIHCNAEKGINWTDHENGTGLLLGREDIYRLDTGWLCSPDSADYTCGRCLKLYWNCFAPNNFYPFAGDFMVACSIARVYRATCSILPGNDYY